MRRFPISILGLTLALAACGSEPRTGPEAGAALLEEVAAAMGGWETIEAIEREELEIRGTAWEPHQAQFPGGILELANYESRLLIDYTGPSMRIEFHGERRYPAPGPVDFLEVIDDDAGAVFDLPEIPSEDGAPEDLTNGQRMRGSRFAARMRDVERMSVRIARVARESETLIREPDRSVDGTTFEVLAYHDGENSVELLLNSTTKLPGRVIVLETDPLYGDTQNELVLDDWRPARFPSSAPGGEWEIPIPFRRTVFLNGDRYREETVESVAINGVFEAGAFDIPSTIRESPERGDRVTSDIALRRAIMGFGPLEGFGSLPEVAPLDNVAPGVWIAGGSSHNSLVIEMSDHLIVAGTPLFDERSIGVIEALNVRFPEKQVRHAVVSHFHADHSGGVRAYAALGATIVAHESIAPFLEVVLSRPRTIRPDALSGQDGRPTIRRVSESDEVSDGSRTVRFLHVPNEHANGMLIVYVADANVVFVSDLYSPPNPVDATDANARAFFDTVIAHGLDVETVVGAHGSMGPFSALARVMGAGESSPE